ncbi:MAG: hypothetical protein IKK57_09005 [Clostridia bacterium]|nr:hypothetical protein [Clostridia bacterium]
MQQLCLTGRDAASLADRLFHALNVQPVGLRFEPFSVGGAVRGHAAYLMPPPSLNAVPCRILLAGGRSVTVPAALEEIAAPGLLAALRIQAPMLISGLSADLLACGALQDAVRRCMTAPRPVIVTADASAREVLHTLVPPETQVWFDVPEDEVAQSALLTALIPEAALRF